MLVGRVLFGVYFVYSGIMHFAKFNQLAGFLPTKGFPAALAPAAIAATGLMLILGGLSLIVNRYHRIGATLLILFLVPTAFIVHNFWTQTNPMMMQDQMAHFLKNLALACACLMFVGLPASALRVDRRGLRVAFAPTEAKRPLSRR
jgi:uncharacterized membrane protein YphA (DoxX/SURF4 family)